MKLLFNYIFPILILSFATNSIAQEYSSINDPVFVNDYPTPILNPQTTNQVTPDFQPLTQTEINEIKFNFSDSEKNIKDKIADQIGSDNISLSKVNYRNQNGTKQFTSDQVKNVTLKSKFLVDSLDVDDIQNKFKAVLKPQIGNYRIEVTGAYSISVKVPLLVRNISKGSTITQDDIDLKDFAKNDIKDTDVTDINNIIGKSATRNLIKGNLVANDDIRNTILVPKNSTVSAIYRTDSIEIKALSVALDDGGEGDVIRLKNFDSGKVFKAVVQADGNVLIGNSVKDLTAKIDNEDLTDTIN